MDGNDLIATLIEGDEIDDELLLDEGTDANQEVIESRQDEIPSSSPFCTEYISKYESNSHSPSPDHSSDQFDPESPSNAESIDELEEISSNIEYLDETEVEYRLTESIQRSKETEKHKAKIQSGDVNADKPNKSSNLSDIKIKTVIKDMEQYDKQVQYHHENLRTVLRCSNATTFLCRGIWYLCTLCRTKYTDPCDLKAHTLKAHKSLKSQRKLYSARKMNRYIVKLDITDLQCKLCSIEIGSLRDLMEHLYSDHGEPMHRDLPNHMIPFKFDGDVLRCTECDREFAFFKMLQCHMNDHYKNFTCEVCDTGYVSFGSLVQHMRLHADGEYKCKWCQKLFHNKHKLADHVKLVHFGHKMRNKCAYCDMKFLVFETRNKHMEEEHGLKAPVVQCQACTKTFRSTRHLTAHTKNFHLIGQKNHECSLCDKRFSAPHMLKAHMAVHSTEKEFKCVVCDKAFSRKKTLREHVRIHANDRRFKCEHCGMSFVQKCSLTGHLKSKHTDKDKDKLGIKQQKCVLTTNVKIELPNKEDDTSDEETADKKHPDGRKLYTTARDVKKNKDQKPKGPTDVEMHRNNIRVILECTNATPIRCHGGIGYQCCFCPEQHPNPADLKTHTIEKHDSKTKQAFMKGKTMSEFFVKLDITALCCKLCGAEIDALQPLMTHLSESHGKKLYTDIRSHILPFKFNDETLRCIFCPNDFNTFKVLQGHMNVHFRNFICETCDSGFVTRNMRRNHMKTHDTGSFICSFCPKVYDTLLKQRAHEKQVHRHPKMNLCPYCNERFRDFTQKVRHLKEAHGVQKESPKCKACDRSFETMAALSVHVKRDHLIQRPHKCTECDMSFYVKAQLRNHFVIHSGTREFACAVCLKTFGRKKTLSDHMRIHTDDRRHKCKHCGMAFVQKSSLRSHVRSNHSEMHQE